jgi:hypothetical protein
MRTVCEGEKIQFGPQWFQFLCTKLISELWEFNDEFMFFVHQLSYTNENNGLKKQRRIVSQKHYKETNQVNIWITLCAKKMRGARGGKMELSDGK